MHACSPGTAVRAPPLHTVLACVPQSMPQSVGNVLFLQAGDGQVAVLSGLLRAAGRQGTGAAINWVSYWVSAHRARATATQQRTHSTVLALPLVPCHICFDTPGKGVIIEADCNGL